MLNKEISSQISPELERTLTSCTNLPSLPAIVLKIIDVSKDPDASLHDVAAIISSDPAIAAKLLKIANSPLYSQRRALNNLREALTLLGFNASLTIALSFSLHHSLGGDKGNEFFWKRSILSASIARMLGEKLGVKRLEELFLAGLLQDIGILVIQCIKKSPYPKESYNLKHDERVALEMDALGIEHSLVGGWLLNSWGLPDYLIRSAIYSHSLNITFAEKNNEDILFHYCLNLSGHFADVWLNENHGELLLSIVDVVKNVLSIDDETLNEFIVHIDDTLPELSSVFDVFLVAEKDREKVLCQARELLLDRSLHAIKKSDDDRKYIDSITSKVEKFEKESRIDHLTKVFNRLYIEKELEMEFEEANVNKWPLSLAFIDIDNFKEVNDTHGHLAGDSVLKSIASFLSENIRETDILARYGGDEFLLMLPGATSEIAKPLLDRLSSLLNKKVHFDENGAEVLMSVSIGLATHIGLQGFDKVEDLLAAADKALYKAKEQGKNCVVEFK